MNKLSRHSTNRLIWYFTAHLALGFLLVHQCIPSAYNRLCYWLPDLLMLALVTYPNWLQSSKTSKTVSWHIYYKSTHLMVVLCSSTASMTSVLVQDIYEKQHPVHHVVFLVTTSRRHVVIMWPSGSTNCIPVTWKCSKQHSERRAAIAMLLLDSVCVLLSVWGVLL